MKVGQRLWTRDELIIAINLYCKLPFGKMHSRNPEINELAKLLNRSPSSVARKLGNFASFDPNLKARGIKGLPNTSKLDAEIWDEFYNNWDVLFIESERELALKQNTAVEKLYEVEENELPLAGEEEMRSVMVRLNQSVFRKMVLANYDDQCCITRINRPELLVAGHIVPWSRDSKNRMNPANGLSLNALHDKAFENGLITINEDFRIKVSPLLLKRDEIKSIKQNFIQLNNKEILLPKKFAPDLRFLKIHNQERFKS